ncbi:MAG: GWxTD domain-containing protein [Gemmatimonadales bacterium]
MILTGCPGPRRAAVLALLLLPAAAGGLAGQAPGVRAELAEFRDSLSTVTDTAGLRRLADALAHRRTEDPVAALQSALATARYAALADGWQFTRARKAFEAVRDRHPAWPWPWYGAGLAEAGRGAWQAGTPGNLGTRVGFGAWQAAWRKLNRALELDPGFGPALLALEQTARRLRDTTLLRPTLDAFRRGAARNIEWPAELELARGRLEREAGDLDSSLAALVRYRDRGDHPGLAWLEIGATRFLQDSADGAGAYYLGASMDDSLGLAAYRRDLAYVADDSSLTAFDRLNGTTRPRWLRDFWTSRDRLDLRPEGDRLRVHYRRIHYARLHYGLEINRRYYASGDAYRSGNAEIDDRGIIYIRHGAPDRLISAPLFATAPNETWVYHRPDGDLLLHFSGGGPGGRLEPGGDLLDYRLVPSILAIRGSPGFRPMDMLLTSRTPLSKIYSAMLAGNPYAPARERAMVEASIAVGTTTDDHPLRFSHPLDAAADLITLGRSESGSLLHLIYGIRLNRQDTAAAGHTLPLRIRLALFDGRNRAVRWMDTSLVLHTATPVRPGQWILGSVAVPAPAGAWRYRLAVQSDSGTGHLFPTDSVTVLDLNGPLALGDLAMGRLPGSLLWITPSGDTAFVSPFQVYRPGEQMSLYYEVYGLRPGSRYTTTISLIERKPRRDGVTRLALSFVESGQPVQRVRRSLSLGELKPGHYWLDLAIRDESGRVERRRKAFDVKQ